MQGSERQGEQASARERWLQREVEELHATASALSGRQLEVDEVLERVVASLARLFDDVTGYTYTFDRDRTRLVQRATDSPFTEFRHTEVSIEVDIDELLATPGAQRARPQGAAPGLCVPIVSDGIVVGALGLGPTEGRPPFTPDDERVAERFAKLASLALERVRLHEELQAELAQRRSAEEELLHTIAKLSRSELALKRSHEEMVRRLAAAAEQRDGTIGRHIERVSETCERIARALGLHEDFCEAIRIASPLHDVGKIGIPDDVLLKPGSLTAEERAVIERHAEIGYGMLAGSGTDLLDLAATIALTHHEHFDGNGYPHGLIGEEIPLEGRIVAVADVFDALTSNRVYRSAFTVDETMRLMRSLRGTQFDPAVFDAFEAVSFPASCRQDTHLSSRPRTLAPAKAETNGRGTVSSEAFSHAIAEATLLLAGVADAREGITEALTRLCRSAGEGVLASVHVFEHDRLWCVAQYGYEQVRDGFTLEQGVLGRAVRAASPQFLEDVTADPDFIAPLPGIVSELAVPLPGREVQAVLNVETVGVALPPDAVETVHPLAVSLTATVDHLNTPFQLDLATLARLVVYASSLRSVTTLSEFAARTLGRLLDLEAAQLTLGGEAEPGAVSFWRRSDSPLQPIDANLLTTISRQASLSEYTFSILDAAGTGLADLDDGGHWLLWLPLRVRGVLVGTLVGRSREPIAVVAERTEAATLFAQLLAALIDVGNALRREQRTAVTDSLTGLLNRRGFDERLREEIARADRSGRPLALVAIDCDNLKTVNDRLGHEGGDALLQGLGRLLRESKRTADIAGRVGGDEFALLLAEADAEAATVLAERVRTALGALHVGELRASASFGVAVYPTDGTTGAALMRAADQALYDAKSAGRNRVAHAGGRTPVSA